MEAFIHILTSWMAENAIENMIKDDPAVSTHKITLQVEGETNQQEFVVPDGFKLGNRYFDGQRYYEYDCGSAGTPDKITEDMMITLRRSGIRSDCGWRKI